MAAPDIEAQAIRLDDYRAGSLDVRQADLTDDLAWLNDTLASVTSVIVAGRDDGVALGANDLSIVMTAPHQPSIVGSYIIQWWQQSDPAINTGCVTIDYQITITAVTAQGRILICDAQQMVIPSRG
jgi:hypothetical protein